MMNQVGIEKSATAKKYSLRFGRYQNRNNPNPCLPRSSRLPMQNKNARKKLLKRDCKEVLSAFFYTTNKPQGINTNQRTYNIWRERIKCTDTHLNPNKLANGKIYIPNSHRLRDAEKGSIKELVDADSQRNESVSLKMNAVNNETDNMSKQFSNDCMKTPTAENEY